MAHIVRVNEGFVMVTLTNGETYDGEVDVTLTDAEFDRIAPGMFTGDEPILTDLGEVADPAVDAVFATDEELADEEDARVADVAALAARLDAIEALGALATAASLTAGLAAKQALIDRRFIGVDAIGAFAAGPNIAAVGQTGQKWSAWLLDAAAVETLSAEYEVPSHWVTMRMIAVILNNFAGSGNVVVQGDHGQAGDTDTLPLTAAVATTVAMPAQNVVKHVVLYTDRAVTPSKAQIVRMSRFATDAGDTFASDLAVLGFWAERVT